MPEDPKHIAGITDGSVQLEMMDDTRRVPHREREADVIRLVRNFVAPLP